MPASEPRQIDWGSSEVEDATLTVKLTEASSKAWKARFESVLAMLGTAHNSWGAVRLTKHAIKVVDLQQGHEAELRHFLESILVQTNSDIEPDAPAQDEAGGEDNHKPDADEQMARTFKGFAAEQESEPEHESERVGA
jgi:hypothetical protein